ncbi:hypothetical protein [Halobacillus sp. K22]|uniref:hypothetical protein n=1 Tax=Halobacillus sp. K22 TaxID=3457431 RepID=UPI003FCD3EE8
MKIIEILLLITAIISLIISLFIQIDLLIMTTLLGGIGFSVLRFVRTYEQRKKPGTGKPEC